ncbi:hypothetical protein GOP47_0004202 [Adiantum capillus-veneris]|uniref:Bifunctional inhibitor/plant lipid transfer protein/seed storage helical domain-containing protein n=1 Tax=Adiantum capillus-veneris TaxID=13818 RepID=A0A9D4V7M9_ADICA|nr:hypothetical protein GOP47_0004202 [Adiantum capillus-veneris]
MMIVVLALLALLAVSSTAADSRESEWRMRLQACDDFMEQRGGQQRERTSQPSQRCCQNLQRISSEDRCRALQQVYGGRGATCIPTPAVSHRTKASRSARPEWHLVFFNNAICVLESAELEMQRPGFGGELMRTAK